MLNNLLCVVGRECIPVFLEDTFGVLIRLATKYKVARLRLACEQFVALLPIRSDQLSADEAFDFLSLSIKYDLSDSAK